MNVTLPLVPAEINVRTKGFNVDVTQNKSLIEQVMREAGVSRLKWPLQRFVLLLITIFAANFYLSDD